MCQCVKEFNICRFHFVLDSVSLLRLTSKSIQHTMTPMLKSERGRERERIYAPIEKSILEKPP